MLEGDIAVRSIHTINLLLITTDITVNAGPYHWIHTLFGNFQTFGQLHLVGFAAKSAQVFIVKRDKIFQIPGFQLLGIIYRQ